jgi:hypothetical protein
MPKKLLIINAILIAIAAGSVVFIARQLMAPMAMPLPTRGRPAPAGPTTAGTPESARLPGSAYGVVASKNLFSPSRAEAPVSAITANAPPVAKPNLFGVVLREGSPIAYLEDPTSKRVSGYRVGDSVAGGTVQVISADSVVITRPDGKLDVRLRDPGKPRPATAGTMPGAQPVGNPPLPGVIPPPTAPPSAAAPMPVQPGIQQPGQPLPVIPPGRRPLPPNLLRRLPQTPTADAPQR